MSDVAEEGACL